MELKDAIKRRICRVDNNYAGMDEFVRWAQTAERPLLFQLLEDLQVELDEEVVRSRDIVERLGAGQLHHAMYVKWSRRCAELQAYYRRQGRRRSELMAGPPIA